MSLKHVFKGFRDFFALRKLPARLERERYRLMLENEIINSREPGVTADRIAPAEVVVSLTTYGPRIETCALAIASIMHQTQKPNRIVLWLAEDEFRGRRLPASVVLLQRRGLEVKFCPDIRSYKKLIPALEAFPNAAVITVDDDLMYDCALIDRLVRAYAEEPSVIWCNRAKRIALDSRGNIRPYRKWTLAKPMEDSPLNFATTGGGTLFPPRIFTPEVADSSKFMVLAPTADDIWFKAMAIAAGVRVKRVMPRNSRGEDYLDGIVEFNDGLAGENITLGRNDKTIAALASYFRPLTEPVHP